MTSIDQATTVQNNDFVSREQSSFEMEKIITNPATVFIGAMAFALASTGSLENLAKYASSSFNLPMMITAFAMVAGIYVANKSAHFGIEQ